ncbi:MAG: transcriptional regulator [Phenylobacterium sp.]|nr:transcriptional regulator [Phenylobacterium sp.]
MKLSCAKAQGWLQAARKALSKLSPFVQSGENCSFEGVKVVGGVLLDPTDRRILRELQADATIPVAELAERVGLSQTPCWKRVKRLTDEGVIDRKVALLNREKLDLGLVVFVSLKTNRHDEAWLAQFAKGASALPEVVEIYRLAGETDYLLKVVVSDIAAYDRFYKRLIAAAPLNDVSSAFAMEQIKFTTALPL